MLTEIRGVCAEGGRHKSPREREYKHLKRPLGEGLSDSLRRIRSELICLLALRSRLGAQPQRDVGRLHSLPNYPHQIIAKGIEVRLIPERRREGLEGLPHAVRVVVIISGMCTKGALDRGREDSGCEERKDPIFIPAKLISYMAGIELQK